MSLPVNLPSVILKSYRIKDESGQIFVLTDNQPPATESEVEVTGVVDVIDLPGYSAGLHLKEVSRR